MQEMEAYLNFVMQAKIRRLLRWPAALSGDTRLQVFVAWLAKEAEKTAA